MSQSDLFGAAKPAQGSLFGAGRMTQAVPSTLPDPAAIRVKLTAVLTTARQASTMPWKERDARMWQTVFPNMSKWLPDDERDQLCFEFAKEIERLLKAA